VKTDQMPSRNARIVGLDARLSGQEKESSRIARGKCPTPWRDKAIWEGDIATAHSPGEEDRAERRVFSGEVDRNPQVLSSCHKSSTIILRDGGTKFLSPTTENL